MPSLGINLTVELGRMVPSPAPARITEALQSLEVTQNDDGPAVFRMTFHADRAKGELRDYFLLGASQLHMATRALFTVTLNGVPRVLMDGFITHQEMNHDRQYGASTLAFIGEDVGVMMDLREVSKEFPGLGDWTIVERVLLPYAALGVVPIAVPVLKSPVSDPVESVPQQNDTDRNYVQQLAAGNGYVFHIRPGPAKLMNKAYWGPPLRTGVPQKALTVDMGPATNVDSINFRYDALRPYLYHGYIHEDTLGMDIPVIVPGSLRIPWLARRTALLDNLPLVRTKQFTDPRPGPLAGEVLAQALVDRSTDDVVVASGQLDVLRYGAVLEAPGVVAVRGAGDSYDGLYYVQSVTHVIGRGSYKQQFTIVREGIGSTVNSVAA
jgi:hypothetical protein